MSGRPDPNPITVSLPWGQDWIVTPNGSVQFCSGVEKIRQRIVRRYYTCPAEVLDDGSYQPADYIMDPDYGLGASRLVGEKISDNLAAILKTKIENAVLIDESVDTTQRPNITLFAAPNGTVWAKVEAFLLDAQKIYIQFQANVQGLPPPSSSG